MEADHRLRSLEVARRRALWVLTDLLPGDARAELSLLELDEIDQALDGLLPRHELSSQALTEAITTQSHNGIQVVIEDSIPEPWRQRFSAASVGSTRLAAGLCRHDFERFLQIWEQEMNHLAAHRAHRAKRGCR